MGQGLIIPHNLFSTNYLKWKAYRDLYRELFSTSVWFQVWLCLWRICDFFFYFRVYCSVFSSFTCECGASKRKNAFNSWEIRSLRDFHCLDFSIMIFQSCKGLCSRGKIFTGKRNIIRQTTTFNNDFSLIFHRLWRYHAYVMKGQGKEKNRISLYEMVSIRSRGMLTNALKISGRKMVISVL